MIKISNVARPFVPIWWYLLSILLLSTSLYYKLLRSPPGSIIDCWNETYYGDTKARRAVKPCDKVRLIRYPVSRLYYNGMGDFTSPNIRALQPFVRKVFHCPSIITRMSTYESWKGNLSPPKPPSHMIRDFLQDGGMVFGKDRYISYNVYDPSVTRRVVTQTQIRKMESDFEAGLGTYGGQNTRRLYALMSKYLAEVKKRPKGTAPLDGDKMRQPLKGLVVGSQSFWVEMLLLKLGVGSDTTSEYANIRSTHPQLSPVFPYALARQLLKNLSQIGTDNFGDAKIEPLFDIGVSYSSLEHSGLDRYGDELNPYGDLDAMAQIWCLTKPGGLFFLNVPFTPAKKGIIHWNAHRIYHWGRIIQMTANWIILKIRTLRIWKIWDAKFLSCKSHFDPRFEYRTHTLYTLRFGTKVLGQCLRFLGLPNVESPNISISMSK